MKRRSFLGVLASLGCLIGFAPKAKADREKCRTWRLREGTWTECTFKELVPGDLICVDQPGTDFVSEVRELPTWNSHAGTWEISILGPIRSNFPPLPK